MGITAPSHPAGATIRAMPLILFGLWLFAAFYAVAAIALLLGMGLRALLAAPTPVRVRVRQEPYITAPLLPQASEPLTEREIIFQAPPAPSRLAAAVMPERTPLTRREIELRRSALLQATGHA
jgi:hypothetical protein